MEERRWDELTPFDYLRVLWKRRRLIGAAVAASVAAALAASFIMTPLYEARAVIMPTVGLSRDQGAATGFLAAQFGVAPPTAPASAEIVNLLKSNILREKLIQEHDLLPLLFSKRTMRGKTENQLMQQGIRQLQTASSVAFSPKDNIITVAYRDHDPKRASDVLGYALAALNDYMSSEARRVAETNKTHLEAQIERTTDPLVKTRLYGLVAQQIETSALAEAKENFAFKVLDPPRPPDRQISPRPALMALLAFFISGLLVVFAALSAECAHRARKT